MGNRLPTVVVIDDAADVRALIRAQLRLSGSFDVVADGADGAAAVELAHRYRPDLMLLDMSMPELDGLEALPGVLTVSPHTRVVVFTGFEADGLADLAHSLGATAFLQKSGDLDVLVTRLREVHQGLAPAPTSAAGQLEIVPDPTLDPGLLDEHLERFRQVFDQAAIGMATLTLTGSIVRANRALCALVGVPPDALVGVDYAALMAGRGELLDDALAQIQHQQADSVRIEHDVSGHLDRKVLASLAPVRDTGQVPLYVFLQVQDITEQRAAKDSLRLSEERFRLLVDAVQDYAIFMLDPDGFVVSWNAGAQRTKGYTAEEIYGHHFRVFYPREQQLARHPEHELDIALREGHYAEEGWRVRKDGSQFWANVLITSVHDDAGEHVGFAKVTRDTTTQRNAQQEQLRAAESLARANDALQTLNVQLRHAASDQSQFLAVTAHELRTPATVMGGSASVLSKHWEALTEVDRQALLDGMTTSAERMQRLLSDLLTASRLDANALRLDRAPTPLAPLVEAAAGAIRHAETDHDIVIDCPDDLIVMVDGPRVSQALDNLIDNALKYGQPPVRLEVRTAADLAQVRVIDSGQGVRPDVRSRLFGRFATGDQIGGTGLGLFIVRELARAHGGDATYEPPSADQPAGAFVLSVPLA